MVRQSQWISRCVGVIAMGAVTSSALAQNNSCASDGAGTFNNSHGEFVVNGGQVSMAGATLFVDFFTTPSSTNDWNDVDGDGFAGFDPLNFPFVDQLATQFIPGSDLSTWWMFQYRSVGSVRGFNEFVENQTCFVIPKSIPSERGVFNGIEYADSGVITWSGPFDNASGTPFEPCEIEGAFLDVPGSYAVQVPGSPAWNRPPTAPGYGLNPIVSSTGDISNLQPLSRDCGECSVSLDACIDDADCPGGETCTSLGFSEALNTDAVPDGNTIYDIVAAWTPVTLIANRGANVENIRYTEAQHLWVTGRMPNGENLTAITRDVGSGTRNAAMNSLGIDTSWGRGDNIGARVNNTSDTSLGPDTQPTNCGGSSILENAVEQRRLGVGYTGLAGGSRSAVDAASGKYEILNVCKDVSATGQAGCDCDVTGFVRPSVDSVLDNCDPCNSFQIAGQGSFSFRGNPNANRDPFDPKFENTPALDNQSVADYINNIVDSIDAFAGDVQNGECNESRVCSITTTTPCTVDGDCPGGETCELKSCSNDGDCPNVGDFCKSKLNSPGQLLATEFFLPAGLDCVNELAEPLAFTPVATNQSLQDFTRTQSVITVPDYGVSSVAGRVPGRKALVSPDQYSDGSTTGVYSYWNGTGYSTISSGNRLSERNQVQGDFNEDFARDVNDAAELVAAYYGPRAWQQAGVANGSGDLGSMSRDNAIPEVLGDFDGDGNLTKEDLRYFADGLAMVPESVAGIGNRRLDRKAGSIAIDNAIIGLGEDLPWADVREQLVVPPATQGDEPTYEVPTDINNPVLPFLATGKSYAPGDFRGDVAGALPIAGAMPSGWDGVVDDQDIDYVCANIGDWSDLDVAVFMDLSADMNGDTTVTAADVDELVVEILGTQIGDYNLDGIVDEADTTIAENTIALGAGGCNGTADCGWADGDSNCDGVVDSGDLPSSAPDAPTDASVTPGHGQRYLEIATPIASETEVIRVIPQNIPNLSGGASVLYVGAPFEADDPDAGDPGKTFTAAQLQCDPVESDFSVYSSVAVYGAEITPSDKLNVAQYTVQRANASCNYLVDEACWSAPLLIEMGHFGDVKSPYLVTESSIEPSFIDINAYVQKFLGDPTAFSKAAMQLSPNLPRPNVGVNFLDIADVVNSFLGSINYATGPNFIGLCTCPSSVTCGATACTSATQCGPEELCIDGFCTDRCGRCAP